MVLINPTGVKVQGQLNLIWVPTFADYTAPTATEVNAVGSLDVSCFVTPEGWNPTINSNKGTAPRRICTTVQFQQFGNTTYEVPTLVFAVDPQAAGGDNGKKAWTALAVNSAGFFVDRQGLTTATTPASGQFVDVWPAKLSSQRLIQGDPTDEFSEFLGYIDWIVTSNPKINVALAT